MCEAKHSRNRDEMTNTKRVVGDLIRPGVTKYGWEFMNCLFHGFKEEISLKHS
jgi:hypothetical protein